MKTEEGYIEVPGGQVWYRAVGDEADAVPLLCLHGGPGFTHYYLEALESLADRRRVIFYDQLGCGRSDRPGDPSLWTWTGSWRSWPRYVRPSISTACTCSAAPGAACWPCSTSWTAAAGPGEPDPVRQPGQHDPLGQRLRELLAEETPETRRVIREHEAAGFTALSRVPGRHPGLLPQARVPPRPVAGRPGALLRRSGLRRLQHDERPERIHRHRHAEDLGHHGPPAGDRASARCSSAAATTNAPPATWRRCTQDRRLAPGDHRGRVPPLFRRAAGAVQPGHQFIYGLTGPARPSAPVTCPGRAARRRPAGPCSGRGSAAVPSGSRSAGRSSR